MAIELRMPALSPTMEEGTLAKWLVKEGDEIKSGDILAEIETDKATMEFEAVDEGQIAKILVPEGTDGVKVGQPIALLATEGDTADAIASGSGAEAVSDTKEEAKPASAATPQFPNPRLNSPKDRQLHIFLKPQPETLSQTSLTPATSLRSPTGLRLLQ